MIKDIFITGLVVSDFSAKKKNRRFGSGLLLLLLLCQTMFFSCGIENYVYLEPVSYISTTGTSGAIISIPSNTGSEFRYYAIFYRIYISDANLPSVTTTEDRTSINPTLASHFNTLTPYTDNDNVSPSSIGSAFTSLRYYPLYVQLGSSILSMQQTLGISPEPPLPIIAAGNIVEFNFVSTGTGPHLKLNTYPNEFPLRRAQDSFTARPDRTFLNNTSVSNAIIDESIIDSTTNADVEKYPNRLPANVYDKAYVSLYIAAAGIDNNFAAIYSKPKHIGVFILPNP
jgi:hypothetical protein